MRVDALITLLKRCDKKQIVRVLANTHSGLEISICPTLKIRISEQEDDVVLIELEENLNHE